VFVRNRGMSGTSSAFIAALARSTASLMLVGHGPLGGVRLNHRHKPDLLLIRRPRIGPQMTMTGSTGPRTTHSCHFSMERCP